MQNGTNYSIEAINYFPSDIVMDKFEVAPAVKDKTTKCERDFTCLTGDNSCLCEVIEGGSLATVKIQSKPDPPCPYCFSLNTFHYCLCPTRNELYKQYKM